MEKQAAQQNVSSEENKKNMLQNTMEREVYWKNILEERGNEQIELAIKKGRKSS